LEVLSYSQGNSKAFLRKLEVSQTTFKSFLGNVLEVLLQKFLFLDSPERGVVACPRGGLVK
jgi:hypothetical protein